MKRGATLFPFNMFNEKDSMRTFLQSLLFAGVVASTASILSLKTCLADYEGADDYNVEADLREFGAVEDAQEVPAEGDEEKDQSLVDVPVPGSKSGKPYYIPKGGAVPKPDPGVACIQGPLYSFDPKTGSYVQNGYGCAPFGSQSLWPLNDCGGWSTTMIINGKPAQVDFCPYGVFDPKGRPFPNAGWYPRVGPGTRRPPPDLK